MNARPDFKGFCIVSTGRRRGHLVPLHAHTTLCGKSTARMPYPRDEFSPELDCPQCYRKYLKMEKEMAMPIGLPQKADARRQAK